MAKQRQIQGALACFLLCLTYPLVSSPTQKTIQAAVPKSFPPHYIHSENTPRGFAIDCIEALAERANVEIDYVTTPTWSKALQLLRSGRVDIIPNVGITPERKKQFAFTQPVETFALKIFTRSDAPAINTLSGLQGKTAGSVTGNHSIVLMKDMDSPPKLHITKTLEEAFALLISGQIDALLYPEPVVWHFAYSADLESEIQASNNPLTEIKRAVAVDNAHPLLKKKFNNAIDDFVGSQKYQEIYTRWFKKPLPFWKTDFFLGSVLASSIIVVILILLWRYWSVKHLAGRLQQLVREQRQTQDELKRNQIILNEAQQMAYLGSWEWNRDSDKIIPSESLKRMLNTNIHGFQTLNDAIEKFVHPEDQKTVAEYLDQVTNSKIPNDWPIEFRIIREDGSEAVFTMVTRSYWDENDQLNRIIGTLQDITQNKQAERALKESENKYRNLVQNIQEGVWAIDPNNTTTFVNIPMAQMIGYSTEEMLGFNVDHFVHPKDREKAERACQRLREGHKERFSLTLAHKKGHTVHTQIDAAPVFEQGVFQGITSYVTDFTEVLQQKEEKRQLEQRLRQFEKMEAVGTLAGGIAHDINNILQGMYFSIALANDSLPEESPARERLQTALKFGTRGRDLVKQILSFSRQQESEKQLLEIEPIIKEAVKLVRATLPAHIIINSHFQGKEKKVWADVTQIHQIIMNLCANSSHAMREQGGTLNIYLEPKNVDEDQASFLGLQKGRYLVLTVTDTGEGIPKDIQERVFDPFFSTKGTGEGTGMGLAVVHGIVKSHNGSIHLDSEPNHGAHFTIYFPEAEEEEQASYGERQTQSSPNGERILLVDDEKELIEMQKELLENHGYKVSSADSGQAALDAFQQNPQGFDLVMTDQNMPLMTGLQLNEKIQALRSDIPIVLCTGYGEMASSDAIQQAGVRRCLSKPVNFFELNAALREVLNKPQATE